jgi:alpha-methylacyl-CoA racemase
MIASDATSESKSGPLVGISVLEIARVSPAAFCARILADLGAEVTRVDAPPTPNAEGFGISGSSVEARRGDILNRGKASISLDLKTPHGQEVALRLAKNVDVLIDGFRPGVLSKLNLGYEDLRDHNPGLIFCAMTGYGQTGPYRDLPGHDLNYLGQSGILNLIGNAGERPAVPLNLVADLGGGAMHAVSGILAALVGRQRSGRGCFVDVSYADAALSLFGGAVVLKEYVANGQVFERGSGLFGGGYPYYSVYQSSDGLELTLACVEHRLWVNFCESVKRPDLVACGPRRSDFMSAPTAEHLKLRNDLDLLFKTKTRAEWFEQLSEAGVAIGVVNSIEETINDRHFRERNMWLDEGDTDFNSGRPQPAFGVQFDGVRGSSGSTMAPGVGEDTSKVLRQLGYSEKAIKELVDEGSVFSHDYEGAT